MRRLATKQKLTAFDEPSPPPAALDLDLSHAARTFLPPVFQRDELPQSIPVVSERTGIIKRFLSFRRGAPKRRVSSMPALSHEKELPSPPQPSQTRAVSMVVQDAFDNHNLPVVHEEDEASEAGNLSLRSYYEASSVYSSLPETYPRPKHVIVDEDNEEIDSLFSGGVGSTIPSETSDTQILVFEAKELLELVEIYEIDSTPSATSEHSNYFFNDGRINFDTSSFKDSLFSGKSLRDTEVNEMQKELPAIPNTQVHPAQPNRPHEQSGSFLVVPKARTEAQRPMSSHLLDMSFHQCSRSTSNFSCSSAVSNMSLKDQKSEMKKQVRQRPFSYCLDVGNDYNYSKYGTPPAKNPRSVSANPYNDPVFSPPKLSTPLVTDLKKYSLDPRQEHVHSKQEPVAPKQCSHSRQPLQPKHLESNRSSLTSTVFSSPGSYRPASYTPLLSPLPPTDSSETFKEQTIRNTIASYLTKELIHPKVPPKDKPLPVVTEARQNRFGRTSY